MVPAQTFIPALLAAAKVNILLILNKRIFHYFHFLKYEQRPTKI